MTKKTRFFWLFLLLLVPIFIFGLRSSAQTADEQLSSIDSQRSALQKQLAEIEKQITQYEKDLVKLGSQKKTLANKIKQLKIKQAQLALQIRETTLRLDDLTIQLLFSQALINQNQRQSDLLRGHLGEIIKQVWKQERVSSFDMLVSADNFSKFYDRLHAFEVVGAGLGQILQSLKAKEWELANSKQKLDERLQEQLDYLNIVNLQQAALVGNLQDQSDLLLQTKGKEEDYQKTLVVTKQRAAEIKNRIYSLIAVGKQITFGQAVDIATWAGKQTGVRPALLLAVLTQESNLGKNVGTCNREGDPASKGWRVIMKPTRDQEPFQKITKELGRNPDITPVSCPMRGKDGKQIGWGGAMGPAQFIPSTWMGYRSKITAITGQPADPWDIRDAFLAASLKLKADGGGSKDGEWAAAMKYFSGSTNLAYRFYGDNVIATAAKYQNDIDELNK